MKLYVPFVVSFLASSLLCVESTERMRVTDVSDPISADAVLSAGTGAVREIITLDAGLAAISGSSVSLFDAETLQSPNGRRPTVALRSDEDLHSLLHVPTLGRELRLMAGTAHGQIKLFKNVTKSVQHVDSSHAIDFCDGLAVPVSELSHVVFGYKHFVLASSRTAWECGIRVFDLEGNLKQTLSINGRVASHRQFHRNKLVVTVNSGDDCVMKTYHFVEDALVTLAENAIRLENVQCGKHVAVDRDGRLLVATTPSNAGTTGALVHIVDVELSTNVLTLASTKLGVVSGVSVLGDDAVLVAGDNSVLVFDHDGHEILRLDMSGVKGTSSLAFGTNKRRVAVGGDDGTIRFFDEVPVPELVRDEYVVKVVKGQPTCLTADDRDAGDFGFGGLKLMDCEGSPLSDDHQLWRDQESELVNVHLAQCLAGFDNDDSLFVTFLSTNFGCLQQLFVAGGLWYTTQYQSVPGEFACIGDSGIQDQFALYPCGGSLQECQQQGGCSTGWRAMRQGFSSV